MNPPTPITPTKNIIWLPCPAKVNLFLHVCGRLPNGYHELQTLFQLLDYGDHLGIELNQSGEFHLADNLKGVQAHDNIIIKAATIMANKRKLKDVGATFYINKNIPMGGGLGGGSSNAATTMLALNILWECGLSERQLLELGAKLGADVPVFIRGLTAYAEGIGEKLTPITANNSYFLVATPNVHIATAEIFKHPDLPRNTPKIDFNLYKFEQTQNDCEKLVCKHHPEVANLLQWLLHYAPSRMTGTGASVFAMFKSEKEAIKVLGKLPKNITAFVAKGLNTSPILQHLHKLQKS